MTENVESNIRPDPDEVLVKIADYVLNTSVESSSWIVFDVVLLGQAATSVVGSLRTTSSA